ncbi:hypothetical protein IE81DRAFT_258938 [Ceraceosorus guamensis]|uniref:Uncharacterized protein n=1 Tax=Ceraceosorus guamensis TaxID=1522189 RepID=A0A316VU18_9BASI|nr:hypothetical protein IE81DRAFT_258938 [Ceraceosorus guamensis]PWN39741.1 hypothetical protein IE81DRAFT_258938 [Ceraceosorus guamensis]
MESAGAARETAGMAVDEEQPRLKRSRTRSRDRSQSRSSHQGSKQSRRREASARQSDRLARKRGKTSTAAARQSVGHEESSSSRLQLDSAANAVDGELEASQFFHHVPHLRPALIGWKLRTRALNRERKLQASSIAIPLANATPPRASSWRDLDGPEGARHEAKIGSRTSTSVSRRSKSARVDPPMGLRLNQPSERSLQVQKLHDLVHLMIAKRDPLRAARALRILMRCHEWRPIELYRMGLEIAGMGCVDKASDRRSVSDLSQPSLHATRAKLNYIRALSSKRAFHRANLLVELVPNLIAMGQGREALEEISIHHILALSVRAHAALVRWFVDLAARCSRASY